MTANAGDILRGGATSASGRNNATARQSAGAQAAEIAKVKAADRLARTTKAVNDMRALQASARAAAGDGGVPDGLVAGGLERLPGGKWTGASAPTQSGGTVNIQQNLSQALLDWKTFNVGRNTTVNFDQTAGGNDSGKWIAFNKVFDPSGKPSQIRGQIKADGQVYIINQNGIIFGAGSQVNARTLVASSLPINDNLVKQGLLNNKDAQFLFSALDVPGGSDGTASFTAPKPYAAADVSIGVRVERGASISSPQSSDGNGGRVMLVGANVVNEGTIDCPGGQTILAAGLQVGVQAHSFDDPSLRGLDVWVGEVGSYGTATNSGLIQSQTGSVWMTGKSVNQLGVIDSSTTVALNGRIDLISSYGAVANPEYDGDLGGPIFINQHTGTVTFGTGSVTRILPDYANTETVPGSSLPINSQVNVEGLSIAMMRASTLLAPHAEVRFRAGRWTYEDSDNNRTIFAADGTTIDPVFKDNLANLKKLFYSGGRIFLDSGSLLDVSGTTDVFVPLSQNILTIQLRGTELADSPAQRKSVIRGEDLTVDLRESGTFDGAAWIGTPLGDLTSLAGVVRRNVSQLTTEGGKVTMESGGSIVVQQGSTVDVSGGYYRYEGGRIRTTRLLRNGNLVNIENATPDRSYDGVYDGRTTKSSSKWGVSKTFGNPLAPLGGYSSREYIAGANGGSIAFTAPSIIVGGDLQGQTVTGPKQSDNPAELSSLSLTFQSDTRYELTSGQYKYYKTSPAPPSIRFSSEKPSASARIVTDATGRLPEDLASQFEISTSWWSSGGGGFGHVLVDNRDGALSLPAGVHVQIPAGGSFSARASNIALAGTLYAPGGTVNLTAYNNSPYEYQKFLNTSTDTSTDTNPSPDPVANRGLITLASTASIDVSGQWIDDRPTSRYVVPGARVLNGGSVSLEGYSIHLAEGSRISADGGVLALPQANGGTKFSYGDGGSISILAGRDPDLDTVVGGSIALKGTLSAYSASKGGALSIRANLIQIGGTADAAADPSLLVLDPAFFRKGGFTSYSLTGIGKSTKPAMNAKEKKYALANPTPIPAPAVGTDPAEETYIPAIRIVANTVIEPVAEQWQVQPSDKNGGDLVLKPALKSGGERKPVSLKFAATGADDLFTTGFIEARGDIVMEKGSVIRTDAGASILIGTDENLQKTLADTVSIEGSIFAPGGTVAVFTRGEFRLAKDVKALRTYALPTIYIGSSAIISTAGKAVYTPDAFGRRTGSLYNGGTISINGNIVAEAGAVLDVSGSSAIFDIQREQMAPANGSVIPATAGLTTRPYSRQTAAASLDSNGGLLEIQGSQMLFSDATLLGRAGGPTATGGTLSVFSGRFYNPLDSSIKHSSDINLVVTQSGLSLQGTRIARGVGLKVAYADDTAVDNVKYMKGDAVPAMGYFAADSFQSGGFNSLDLGYKYLEKASPLPFGGNVQFRGPVVISARGSLRVAGGGIIQADSPVRLSASTIAVGQKYRQPVNPQDSPFVAFQQDPADLVDGITYFPQPTYGSGGSVHFAADLIDIGTTVFKNTGSVSFTASNGDIRGDGTLSVAGAITMTAGQIYPATLGEFNIFAYDYKTESGATGRGSVTIVGSGTRPMPYSAGGALNIFASTITQGGTLRAPFGSITLGWDGTTGKGFDAPTNPVVGTKLTIPTTQSVVLTSGSITSVSAVDPATGIGLAIPFGISPDGLTWYDPRGVNVTVAGLPEKKVSIAGNSVTTEYGSTVDLRGGGDLLAYRWVAGNGGSRDLLGETAGDWSEGASYAAGNLVTYKGKTWSARRPITPEDYVNSPSKSARNLFSTAKSLSLEPVDAPSPPKPEAGSIYWTEVRNSYAVLPGYSANYAPSSVYNTGSNAKAVLGGDPGFTSSSLKAGDKIYLDGVDGLSAGLYTLFPRRYALLDGAFLVTPKTSGTFSTFATSSGSLSTSGLSVAGKNSSTYARFTSVDGAEYASGYRINSFNPSDRINGARSLFEVASPTVLGNRAAYEIYGANDFMTAAATRLDVAIPQEMPQDSGYLVIHGNSALSLQGDVRTAHPPGGRGATIDLSSDSDMSVVGGTGSASGNSKVVLNSEILNSWGAESLLIGGIRQTGGESVSAFVRAPSVTVNNPGSILSSPEITLVANRALTVSPGSTITSSGALTQSSKLLFLSGEGVALRVSGDKNSDVVRTSFTDLVNPVMTIGSGAKISGPGVILDSSYATSLDANAILEARYLKLGSGQISIRLDGLSGALAGSVVTPHLTLEGNLLTSIQSVESLTLLSYRTIDIYGTGTFGSPSLGSLNLFASGVRGYGTRSVTLSANTVTFANPSKSAILAAPAPPLAGSLNVVADKLQLGANDFRVDGYQNLNANLGNGLMTTGSGNLTVAGALTVVTPLITSAGGMAYGVNAGTLSLLNSGAASTLSGGLGSSLSFTGTTIFSNARISLPSGSLTLHATGGSVTVGGGIDVSGSSKTFYDVVRYADAGNIRLISDSGDVVLAAGGILSVAAASGGGNAGTIEVRTGSSSQFINNGTLLGSASTNSRSGSFILDAGSITSFASINDPLETGGFFEERNIRVRNGDVTIDRTAHARNFSLSTDAGTITVAGRIDASGNTGGSISLSASRSVILNPGASLTVAAQEFSSAGKGGSISIEAGANDSSAASTARVDIQAGSTIDLSVAAYRTDSDLDPLNDYLTVGTSAFYGQFQGTLHLRAPRISGSTNVGVNSLLGTIAGASSVLVEGFKIYTLPGGVMNTTLRTTINTDSTAFLGAAGIGNANELAIRTKLLTGAPSAAAIAPVIVIAPGVEIINPTGDLTLGLANPTGSTNAQAISAADWDLSAFRYGTKSAPGVLTLRARGDLVFNNTLSDGFTPVSATTANGNSTMWLAPLKTIVATLPTNTQSWSFRLTSGSDLAAADFRSVLPTSSLTAGKGSLLVGEFYGAIPNTDDSGTSPATGTTGLTANSIRISKDGTNRGTRYEVIRTGTGNIIINAGRDVQLRNQFATIYTAGVAVPTPTAIFQSGDFVVPIVTNKKTISQSGSGVSLGTAQQDYAPSWSLAGGDVDVTAKRNIGHYTVYTGPSTTFNDGQQTVVLNPGDVIIDSSRQMPNNWLYRRGYTDSDGVFASDGGVDGSTSTTRVTDPSSSTAWWVDFSNFFEGVGALGGGNVSLIAGNDIVNVDAVVPTNARTNGVDPLTGKNVLASDAKLLEYGGGDITVRAGNNIDGGVYYVENGSGSLFAGGSIKTNWARSTQLGILDKDNASNQFGTDHIYSSQTWLPTTLFVGNSFFDVRALKDVLLGPVANTFLLPQGQNNKFWYKAYFQTLSATSGVSVASFGGSVTHRLAATLPGGAAPTSILSNWLSTQNLFAGDSSALNASNFQPWLRLAETDLSYFENLFSLNAANLSSTAFAGDVNIAGPLTLFPSSIGNLELVASGSIVGMQPTGLGAVSVSAGTSTITKTVSIYASSSINMSDADPGLFPDRKSPLAFQKVAGRNRSSQLNSVLKNPFTVLNASLKESGSYSGQNSDAGFKRSLHSPGVLHSGDTRPVRFYSAGGSVTGFTLFAPKVTRIIADKDVTDDAFYLQNTSSDDVSLISAGRNVTPYNANSPMRALATDLSKGNYLGDAMKKTSTEVDSNVLAGDIQINGRGFLEVLAGRNIDLGTGPNYKDGTGVGITSIGNLRNPFLPFTGADIVIMAGVKDAAGGAPVGLTGSSLDFQKISLEGSAQQAFASAELQNISLLGTFFKILEKAGDEWQTTGSASSGYDAIDNLFGKGSGSADIFTRARDIRTSTGGAITIAAPSGGLTMASDIYGNPNSPPGIVTEYGGKVSIFTDKSVDIGRTRIFTLRGGDMTIWSSKGDIAAGTSPKTVVTAPPTRVSIDTISADVATDPGGLATGGGIGVLASVKGVPKGSVSLIAPQGTVDAGDAGIQATGDVKIAAVAVLNAENIAAGGSKVGVPSAPTVAAPNVSGLTSASSSTAATSSAAESIANQGTRQSQETEAPPSVFTVEVLGYGGGEDDGG